MYIVICASRLLNILDTFYKTYNIIMAAILAQQRDVEEEYLWSCALTATNKEYSWDPVTLEPAKEEGDGKEEGRQVMPSHLLFIETAFLMPTAKKDEVTVVEIESEGFNKQKVGLISQLVFSMIVELLNSHFTRLLSLSAP